MPGNTATIDVASLRVQWQSHVPIAQLCANFTVTRDQMTRLKFVFHLPPRHDRSLRYKPPRAPKPTAEEERASRESLSLAPQIAERATAVQALWTDEVRAARTLRQTSSGMLRWVKASDIVQRFLTDDEPAP